MDGAPAASFRSSTQLPLSHLPTNVRADSGRLLGLPQAVAGHIGGAGRCGTAEFASLGSSLGRLAWLASLVQSDSPFLICDVVL